MEEYLDTARGLAASAVARAGVLDPSPSHAQLFDFPEQRPMQKACQSMPLPDGSALALIEDETGSGKTEAALMLAQCKSAVDRESPQVQEEEARKVLAQGMGHGLR